MAERDVGGVIFQALGGAGGFRRLAVAFYARVPNEPELARLYSGFGKCPIDHLATYLAEAFGGPAAYSAKTYFTSLTQAHARFRITADARSAWLRVMREALAEAVTDPTARDALDAYFEIASADRINIAPPSVPGPDGPDGSVTAIHAFADVSEAIVSQRAVDAAFAAASRCDTEVAIAWAASQAVRRRCDNAPMLWAGLLAAIGAIGDDRSLGFVAEEIARQPGILSAADGNGWTLLCRAAHLGAVGLVELALKCGADPNLHAPRWHRPLYYATEPEIVRLLAASGADLDAGGGAKGTTALHRAARFGLLDTARALLDAGANIEVRDAAGHTPLRRAVNAAKSAMVGLLIERGADVNTRCNKGQTPRDVARRPTPWPHSL